ncbi:MAG: 3-coathanger stack domain-containing protein, partial [Bacteroidales bacterium]
MIDQYGTEGPWLFMAEGSYPDKNFGFAVAVDGKTAVIGSPHTAWNIGQAYIYRKTSIGTWIKISTLKSSDNNPDFGRYIDISGDNTCVLGSDKVYFFKRGNPDWDGVVTELKYNSTSQTPKCVSIWGDYAVVGFPSYSNYRGKVSIFYRNQGGVDNWGIVKELIGDGESDFFGNSVDLYNDQLVIGAPQGGNRQGYLKIFNRNLASGNDWGEEEKIIAPPFWESESGTSEFGKNVSVFENTVSSVYYRWTEPAQYSTYGPRLWPVAYRKNSMNDWDMIEGGGFGNVYPEGNFSTSATMFKSESIDGDEGEFRGAFGIPFEKYAPTGLNYGSYGSTFEIKYFDDPPYRVGGCLFSTIQSGIPYYPPHPDEQYGNSVSFSYMSDVIGIPGYDNVAGKNVGMAMFDRNQILGNNLCEAGIDLSFVNFTKPPDNYSDIIARNITLGGRALPAIIENGANIEYKANELLLKDGFLADHGSDFTALALDCGSGNSDMLVKKSNQNI